MKDLLKKQREILAILIYAATVAGLFYFLIFPLIVNIEERSNQIQEEAMKRQSTIKRIADLPKIQSQFKMLNESGKSADILLDKDKAVILIEKLEKLAESTNNNITIVIVPDKIDQPKKATNAKAKVDETLIGNLPNQDFLQMRIVLVGKYDAIRNFVRLLEDFEYYNDIVGIQITNDDGAANASVHSSSAGLLSTSGVITSDGIPPEQLGMLKASFDTVFYAK